MSNNPMLCSVCGKHAAVQRMIYKLERPSQCNESVDSYYHVCSNNSECAVTARIWVALGHTTGNNID